MSVHDGHRKRLKDEFLKTGLLNVPEHRALELLLFYAIPQGDVNPLAHQLIERFGSLAGVLDATEEELRRVPGIGEHTVVLLKLVPALCGRYLKSKTSSLQYVTNTEEARAIFAPYFFGRRNEVICMACLDASRRLLNVRVLSEGGSTGAELTLRSVLEIAFSLNATTLILAHNHTGGTAEPSAEDVDTTRILSRKLFELGLYLQDHLIFADEEVTSMRQLGLLEI